MTATENRTSWLGRILSPFQAKQAEDHLLAKREETEAAAQTLDAAGIQRKTVSKEESDKRPDDDPNAPPPENAETEPPSEEDMANDPVMKVARALQEQLKAGAQGDYANLTDEGIIATLANAMRDAMPADPIRDEEREQTEPEDQTMADDNKKEMGEVTKALTDTLQALVTDQGAIAKAYTEQHKEIESLKALKPAVDELVKQVSAINAVLASRPRSVTDEDATPATLTPEAEKALRGAIEKGLNGEKKKFFNIPVTEEPK